MWEREYRIIGYEEPEIYIRRGITFSETEIRHLAISVIILSIVFTLGQLDGVGGLSGRSASEIFFILIVSVIVVSTGFLLHELAHKVVAQRFGCWAEYRYFGFGLLLALFLSFIGIVFAAPGAVFISGYISREENGKISIAGPLTNVLISLAFIPFIFIKALSFVASIVSLINIILAGFNMIPFMPLDGAKVLRWSISIYIITLVVIVSIFVLLTFYLPQELAFYK